MVELLAPAGSREALAAAVESGANAVYLAGNMFGARAYADNFDEEGLKEAIHFAHMRNVHIHVTVNTIVDDNELPGLKQYLRFLYEAGADAVLVQDLGAARIVREVVPELPMHASTQMTVTGPEADHSDLPQNEQVVRLIKHYLLEKKNKNLRPPRQANKKRQ